MPGDTAVEDRAKRYLEALREELQALGMASELVPSASEPRLLLGKPHFWRDADSWFESHVLAAQVAGTGWCYWWPSIQVIGPADDPASAAAAILDELGVVISDRRQGGLHAR